MPQDHICLLYTSFIACNDLAPLHNPANLKGVNAVSAILPNVPQVGDVYKRQLVAYLLYQTYRLMKDSGSINIVIGILVFIGSWLIVSQVLEMKLLGSIFDKLVSVGAVSYTHLRLNPFTEFLFRQHRRCIDQHIGQQTEIGTITHRRPL